MKSIISYLFLLQATTNLVNPSIAYTPPKVQTLHKCRPNSKYKSAAYKTNINTALTNVAKNMPNKQWFFHTSVAIMTTDQVNALGLCPPYITTQACGQCIKNFTNSLLSNCPGDKEAVMWTANCMLRYSDRKIYGDLDNWHVAIDVSKVLVPKGKEMEKALIDLVGRLQKKAAEGIKVKFAYGYLKYATGADTVFAAVQCTPAISKEDCNKCLSGQFITLHPCCSGKMAGRLCAPNCYIRFAHEKFDG